RRSLAALAAAAACATLASPLYATDGSWSFNGSGSWSDPAAWVSGAVADGSGATADFNQVDLTSNATITLDSSRTLSNLIFGDTDPLGTPATWTLATGTNTLTLAGTTPTVTANTNTAITGIIAGTSGLTKAGSSQLDISVASITGLTGGINIAAGTVVQKGNTTLSALTNSTSGGNTGLTGSGTFVI